jgi:predicted O-linked N-acetylglucosamine transferase (SPINDLY family)
MSWPGGPPINVFDLVNRAMGLHRAGRLDEAEALYRRVLEVQPAQFETLHFFGLLEAQRGRLVEGERLIARSLQVNAERAEAFSNHARVLNELKRSEDAIAACDRALAINPRMIEALVHRGNALHDLLRPEEGTAELRKALAVRPNPVLHSHLIFFRNFETHATTAELQADRADFGRLYGAPLAGTIRPHANRPDPARKLRVGYMSGYFRRHSTIYAFGGVLLEHDPAQLDIVCYSDTVEEDALSERFRGRAHAWRRIVGLTDDQVAEMVRADAIDILVDAVGHMSGNRLLVFARKPAPIQVTAWGEPTGTGLATMDYLLADPVLAPESERRLLPERIADLPNFLAYWAPEALPEPVRLPALDRGYVTFGSFNRHLKLQDPVLRVWADILRRSPTARLVIKAEHENVARSRPARIKALLAEQGVAEDRVTLIGRDDRIDHFSAYHGVDIALDPFPHGGGMTTLDALWMGVPTVTFPGRTFSSRLAAASMTAVGLADFVAADQDGYVGLAIAKAADLDALAQLRAGLRARVATSAIGDQPTYTRAVEAAYREMWRRWCAERGAGGAAPVR